MQVMSLERPQYLITRLIILGHSGVGRAFPLRLRNHPLGRREKDAPSPYDSGIILTESTAGLFWFGR